VRDGVLPPEAAAAAADPQRALAEFVLVTPLGQGGTAEVWKAWDRRLDRWVALKICMVMADSASARERFEREALAVARLSHPGIVQVFQVGTDRGRSYLVMPYIDGRTLEGAELPPRRAIEVMHAVALAVEHAHAQGVVHRDLKPGNILVDRDGGVRVLDFGLAFLREQASQRLTRPGEVLGTASYMAPEQARGDPEAHETAIDVYGLGATFYFLVTGRAPFVGDRLAAVLAKVVNAELVAPSRVRPELDPRIDAVVLRAMDKDPRRRYPTAAAFAEDLQRILDDRAVEPARAAPPAGAGAGLVRRHASMAVAAAAALAGAAVIALGLGLARDGGGAGEAALARGLVAHFAFDEGRGTRAADSSGGGLAATLLGGVTWAEGRLGQAVHLDGFDDHVMVPHAAALDLRGPLTVAAWVKFSASMRKNSGLVAKGTWPGPAGLSYALRTRWRKTVYFQVRIGGRYISTGAHDVGDLRWHHVAGLYTGRTLELWVDGTLRQEVKDVSGAIDSTAAPLLMGEMEFHAGALDDVRVYSRALSEAEIRTLAR
jgi:hypothetical protein